MRVFRQKGKMRYACHPEPKNGIGAWGSQGQEDHAWDDKTRWELPWWPNG